MPAFVAILPGPGMLTGVDGLVLAAALASGCSARREREATLRLDLHMMGHAIDKYTLEKEQAPQSLQDLLNGYFLNEIPTDPFTRKKVACHNSTA